MHRLEFRIELEGNGRDAVHELVQKNPQLLAGAVDQRDDIRDIRCIDRFQTRELLLDFLRIRSDRIEADHEDRARCLVHVIARMR